MNAPRINDLQSLLDELEAADHDDGSVSLQDVIDVVGHRSFGPVLVLPGLLVMSPAGGIPGMATAEGVISLFVAVQLLFARRSLWLPRWLLRRRLRWDRYRRALALMRKPGRVVDRVLRPRLEWAVRKPALQLIALLAALVAMVTPMLEVVPFADTVPAAALTSLGLALIARDGLFALIAAVLGMAALALVMVAVF